MRDESGDYEVGYRRPPKQHQFKKGRSGNPKGRPPLTHDLAEASVQAGSHVVEVPFGGKKRRMTLVMATAYKAAVQAAAGDANARRFLAEQLRIAGTRGHHSPECPITFTLKLEPDETDS